MKTRELPECADVNVKGAYPLEPEVREDGTRSLVCPCCPGSGERRSPPGNNPNGVDHPCGTCRGEGNPDKVIPIDGEKRERRKEPDWEAAEISNRLSIRPDDDLEGWWNIQGKWEGQSGMGNTREVVQLARLILERWSR